ncbi:MAG: flavin reductase [Prevotellaceae bacterium]|nr:flavin reductase [Prevotellaceae bacterium]
MRRNLFIFVAVAAITACGGSGTQEKNAMNEFKTIPFDAIRESATKLVSNGFLVTAGNDSSFNVMTAGWGAIGHLWGRDVALIFVRPQRYTFQFLRREEYFTLSFLPEEHRDVLTICGTLSGRDADKVKKAGLTPVKLAEGVITFQKASKVIVCKKLYGADFINPEAFVDTAIVGNIYPQKDFHHMFVGEIVETLVK